MPYLPLQGGLATTLKFFDDLADSGGNFARYWMADWSTGIEWHEGVDNYGGIGRYNLKNAWLIDRVLERCEQRGIRVVFETLNHVRLSPGYSWGKNPFSIRNGGFLRNTWSWWTDRRMVEPSQNRLRYIVARYAHSPSVHSWGYISEADLVGGGWGRGVERVAEYLRFMSSLDPYGHIASNHICRPRSGRNMFGRPEVEFVNSNAYAGLPESRLPLDQPFTIRGYSEMFASRAKPVVVGEYAGAWQGDRAWKMRRDTVSGLWAGVASDLAGVPLSWWWNFNYGESLGYVYGHVAAFMEGEDLIAEDTPEKGGWANRRVTVSSRAKNARALMVGNRLRRFVYVFNFDTVCRTRSVATSCDDVELRLSDLAEGEYEAEFWHPERGKTDIARRFGVGADASGTLACPSFTEGWVVKVLSLIHI